MSVELRLWLAFSLPALAAAPLLRRAFPGLRDGGVSLARPAGWLLVAWVAWFTASLPGLAIYGTPLVLASAALLAALGAAVGWKDRAIWKALLAREWRTVAIGEGLGLLVFAVCLWLVKYNGDVHPLAERFMDYAILRRLEFSTSFPPLDSWMAGLTLQYYYYGYVVMDVLRRLAGLTLREFFNPALAGVYATFAIALYGAGMAVGRSRGAGIAAAVGAAFVGNYDFARQIVDARWKSGSWKLVGLDWFGVSRVIDGTINETPTFAFFWGDLHPYLIAFPFVVLAITLAVASLTAETHPLAESRPRVDRALALALLVIPLGSLFPTNSWDFPTFLGLALAALAWPLLPPVATWAPALRAARVSLGARLAPRPADAVLAAVALAFSGLLAGGLSLPLFVVSLAGLWLGARVLGVGGTSVSFVAVSRREGAAADAPDPVALRASLARIVVVCGAVALLSVIAYLGFHIGFGKQVGRGIRLAQQRSEVVPMLLHFGPWFAAIFLWAVATSKQRATLLHRALPLPLVALALVAFESWGAPAVAGVVKSLAGGGPGFLAQALDHLFLRGLAFGLLIAALWVLLADLDADEVGTPEGVSRLLAGAALFVVLVCEFAYVDDFYGGKNERMNTVFKAYIQAWILLGVAAAGLLAAAWRAFPGRLFKASWEGAVVAGALVFAAVLVAASPKGWFSTGGARIVLLVIAPFVVFAWCLLRDRRSMPKAAWVTLVTLALLPGLAFAALGDYNRSGKFRKTRSGNEPTMDPLDLFREKLPGDYQAMAWVEANIPPDDVILEASAHAYEWESRIATFTGRRTLIGWRNHESGWRNDWSLATERGKVIDDIYGATSLEDALALCREHGIDWIYLGELERGRAELPDELPAEEVRRRLGPPLTVTEGTGLIFGRSFERWERWTYGEFHVWIGDGKLARTDRDPAQTGYHPETFAALEPAYASDRVAIYRVPAGAPQKPAMSKN